MEENKRYLLRNMGKDILNEIENHDSLIVIENEIYGEESFIQIASSYIELDGRDIDTETLSRFIDELDKMFITYELHVVWKKY